MLVIGLVCGAVLAALYLGYRENEPGRFGSGIRSLLEQDERAVEQSKAPVPEKPGEPAPRVKLDYHEVLPNIDEVLLESGVIPDDEPVEERPEHQYILQAGSYRSERDAERVKAELALAGFESVIQRVEIQFKGTYYRVRLGPYTSKRRMELHRKQLSRRGINALAIRLDD
jgi:cell division protein FtsN